MAATATAETASILDDRPFLSDEPRYLLPKYFLPVSLPLCSLDFQFPQRTHRLQCNRLFPRTMEKSLPLFPSTSAEAYGNL